MYTNKKKCGGSPETMKVRFIGYDYELEEYEVKIGKTYILKEYEVKIGTTYEDVLIRFLESSIGSRWRNDDNIGFIALAHGQNTSINDRNIEFEIPRNDYGTISILLNNINRFYNNYPGMQDLYEITTSKNIFKYRDGYNDRKQAIIKNKRTERKKIPMLKKQLPKLLESVDVNEVNSINLKSFRKNNSTTSAKSDTEYVDEDKIIRLSRKENNKEFVTWHDKDDLLKWLKQKSTLPTSRTTVTAADIKKIEDSVGYGQLIKIGSSASPEATTSNGAVRNNPANASSATSSAASSRRTASGRSIITVNSTPSNRSSASAPSRRSSARTASPTSRASTGSPTSRASTNNPDGSRRSSARTTPSPRLSPRSNARRDS